MWGGGHCFSFVSTLFNSVLFFAVPLTHSHSLSLSPTLSLSLALSLSSTLPLSLSFPLSVSLSLSLSMSMSTFSFPLPLPLFLSPIYTYIVSGIFMLLLSSSTNTSYLPHSIIFLPTLYYTKLHIASIHFHVIIIIEILFLELFFFSHGNYLISPWYLVQFFSTFGHIS